MTDMFGNYKSQETRVLQSINSSKYPDTNIDLERNLQRLNSFVDYISQYLQVMQKGVDQANQDIFQRTRDVLQNFGVLLAGGAIFDNDFGDLQYFLPAIGALLGFDKDTPFPINLFHAAENLLLGYVVPLDAFGMAIMDQINNWADQLNINQEFMSELNEWVAAVGGLGATFGELVQNLFGMFDIFGVNENGLGFLGDIWHGISQLFGGFNLEVIGDLTDPILAALAPWLGRITDAVGWISSILKSWSNGLESLDGIINFSGLFSGINWAAPDFDIGDAVQEWMNNVLVPTNIFAHRVEFGTLSDLASQLDEAVNNLLAWFADILDRFGLDVVSQWIDDLLVTRGATNTALTNASTAQAKADLAEALANVGILRAKFGSNLLYSPNFENTTIQYWPYVSLEVSAYSYATEYRHSGNRSLRVLYDNAAVAAGEQGLQLRVEPSQPYMPAQPQSWYWVEGWFYVYSTHSNSGRLKVFADAKDSTGVNAAQKVYVYDQPFSGITKGVWTKFSGHIQLPAGLDQFTLVVSRSGCALNDAIYFDDMVMREVTEAKLANALATAAQALANTAQSLAQQALANFTAMLDRFGFTQIADWIEDLFGVKTTANTATANAATAIANAATADAKAVTAQTSNQTTVDNLYDAFNGTTGTTGQTTANMRNRGAAVRNSAITGETNSATALTNAATADAKAITAQAAASTADGKAVAADGKAVAAQTTANTANTAATAAQTSSNTAIAMANSAIVKGQNFVTNPGFENSGFYLSVGSYSTEQKRSGTQSLKLTGINQWTRLQSGISAVLRQPVSPGDVFYYEGWVYGHASNTNAQGTITVQFNTFTASGATASPSYIASSTVMTNGMNGVWTKFTGTLTIGAGTNIEMVDLYLGSAIGGSTVTNSYYFDDIVMYRITESYVADTKAVAAQGTANTAVTNANTAKTNASIADGKAVAAQSAAATADAKAVTADGKAVVAQAVIDAVATSGNLVVSPNFEDSTVARPKFNNGTGFTYEYVTDAPFQGSKCLKITVTTPGWNGINLSPTPTLTRYDVKEGDTYRATVKVKLGASMLTRAGGNVRLFVRFHKTGAGATFTDAATGSYQVNSNTAGADTWLTLDCTGTCPANRDQLEVMAICNGSMLAGDFFYLDAASVENITWANAAQADANTAKTNASIADGKAVVADTKALVAQTRLNAVTSAGANLVTNPGFEDATAGANGLYLSSGVALSTEQKRGGTYSLKFTATGSEQQAWLIASTSNGIQRFPAKAGMSFAVEYWIYGHASNVSTTGGVALFVVGWDGSAWVDWASNDYASRVLFTTPGINGTWTKVSTTVTLSNANVKEATAYLSLAAAAGSIYYFDDVVVRDVTEAQVADTKAVAAQATANTGVANAARADGKAVTADDKAVAADTKAVNAQAIADASIASGNNMLPNGDFENTSFWQNGLAYTTDQKYNGTRSVTFTSNGTWASGYPATTTSNTRINFPCQGGDIFWFDGWIMGKSTNTVSSSVYGTSIAYDKDGNDLGSYTAWTVDSLAVKDVWTKVGGFITMPANATSFTPYFSCNMTSGEVFYIDNLRLYRATEAYNADAKAVTADGKAVTADGKAVTADGKAVTAQTAAANAATAATTADDKAVTAQGAANDATNIGVNNSVDILELKTAQQGGAVSGYSATDTFNYTGTTLDSTNWNIQVTGTNGRLGANGVDAYWINGATTDGTTTEFDYWKTATNSDYQIVSVVVGNPFYGNSTAGYGPVARCDSTRSNYVWVQIQTTTLKLYKVVAGVQTQIGSTYTIPGGQQSKSGDVIQLEAGSSANVRQFKVRRNGNIVIDATDSAATLSVVGSNNRFPGLRYYVYANNTYVYTEGNVAAWSVTDNAPPDYVGSGFRAVKSSGSQSCSNNYNLLPNSFFTQEYKTADYTYAAATANKLTVSVSGWYHVELSLGLTINTMITDMAVCIYKNGVVNKKAGSVWGVSNVVNRGPAGVAGSFIVYLSAGDYIQPGYWQTTTYGGSGTIVGDSNSTYFDVALINKSML